MRRICRQVHISRRGFVKNTLFTHVDEKKHGTDRLDYITNSLHVITFFSDPHHCLQSPLYHCSPRAVIYSLNVWENKCVLGGLESDQDLCPRSDIYTNHAALVWPLVIFCQYYCTRCVGRGHKGHICKSNSVRIEIFPCILNSQSAQDFIFSSWLLVFVCLCACVLISFSFFQASRGENLNIGSKAREPQLTTVT